ncbi:hypothetical protein SNE40_016083 [Patella caerulea]|uniref:CWF19-like protein 2 n=1 Tax=Patella caerulea TaxID=87958 RepID=A0AAN8JC65_PATCE
MSSGIRFVSSNLLEERRDELREAREVILDKAKRKYEKEERRKEQAKLRGEDKWMLPSVDSRITKESTTLDVKKKKAKKEKKKKKKKKKTKGSSSDDSGGEEEWVECKVSTSVTSTDTKQPVIKGPTVLKRDSWMEAPLDFLPLTSRQEIRDKQTAEKEKEEKKESVIEQMGQHARELNPYWKDGGAGLPSEKQEKEKSVPKIGDGGAEWLKKSYARCKEQAREEGRSFEELVSEKWGSVKKIERMIADAEKSSKKSSSERDRKEDTSQKPNFHRPSSSSEDKYGRNSDRGRDKDRPRFQRPSSPDSDRLRDTAKSSARESDQFRDRDKNSSQGNSRDKDRDRRRFQRPSSPSENRGRSDERHRSSDKDHSDDNRRRFQRPSSPSENSDRKLGRFQRPSSPSDYRQSSPDRRSSQRSRSPRRSDRDRYSDRRDDYRSSRSEREVPRWKKKSEETKKTSPDKEERKRRSESPSRKSSSSNQRRKRHKSSSSSSSSDSSSSSSESESETEEAPPQVKAPVILTEAEMNGLAAKILKAEIMGDETLANELKTKLENAREAKKNAPPAPTSRQPEEEGEVLLTRTTKTGFVMPLSEAKHAREPKQGRKRQKKISTHEDGNRTRYFDDDDKLDLKTMVEREKMGTAEDQNSMFARLAGRSVEKTDDDYQVDDMFISKAARQQSEAKLEEKDKLKSIMEHQKMTAAIARCQFCFDKVPKHMIIAIGKKSYLCLPQHKPLTVGHCQIVPMMHCPAATAIDEDVWQEMQTFRKTLTNLFSERGEDCIFMETSMFLKRQPHTFIDCIPLEREVGDLAPIYFKKAIQDSESEWSQNVKVVDLSKKDIRHSVPKGFPYFCVDFGHQGGFAHVIEDEQRFPTYFGREVVGGMIDANHKLWKNPPKENFDEQRIRVLEFSEWWQPHDWTQNI